MRSRPEWNRQRWVRRAGQLEPTFTEIIAHDQVEQRPLDFTIAEHALELATDETHRVIGAFGGQRGSKTHTAAQWTTRQWMLKGGPGAFGWWCALSRKQAWEICVGKLAGFGPKGDAPLCPDLVVRYPKSEDSGQQRIVFIDGAHIDLIPLDERRKGGNAKGFTLEHRRRGLRGEVDRHLASAPRPRQRHALW